MKRSFCFVLLVVLATSDPSIHSRLLQEKLLGLGPQLSVHTDDKGFNIPGLPSFPNLQDLFDGADAFIDVFESQDTRDALKEALTGNFEPTRTLLQNGKFDPIFDSLDVHPDTDEIIDTAEEWLNHEAIRRVVNDIASGRQFVRAILSLGSGEVSAAFFELINNRDVIAFFNSLNDIFGEEESESANPSEDPSEDGEDSVEDPTPEPDSPMCCAALTADCASCSLGVSVEEFCLDCRNNESLEEACLTCPVLTQCQQLNQQPGNLLGVHRPQCEADGSFSARQCRGSTGYCWCVDFSGKEIEGTSQPPGSRNDIDCHQMRLNQLSECQLQAFNSASRPGAFRPRCAEDGSYNPLQCHGSTGYCWCVNEHGRMLDGTRTPPGNGQPACVLTYDCTTDSSQWDEEKSAWCCSNNMLGCPEVVVENNAEEEKDSKKYAKAVVVSSLSVFCAAGVFVIFASRRYYTRQPPRAVVKTVDAIEA